MTPPSDHPPRDPAHNPPRDRSLDDLIQSILDRPLDDPSRRDLINAVRRDPDAMRDLHASADALARLRRPVDAPDLSARILHAAHARRGFLPPRLRRWVDRTRFATAAALLLTLGLVAAVQRHWPDATRLATPDRPLSALPRALSEDAYLSAGMLSSGLTRARDALAPIAAPAHDPASLDAFSPDALPHRLQAWVLSVSGPDGSVFDTVMTFDRHAPPEAALRVFTLPPRPDCSVFSVDAPFPLPAPRAEPQPLP